MSSHSAGTIKGLSDVEIWRMQLRGGGQDAPESRDDAAGCRVGSLQLATKAGTLGADAAFCAVPWAHPREHSWRGCMCM
jgi:hypothetical protein